MTQRQLVNAIKQTGILPGSYFPSRAFPIARPAQEIIEDFCAQVDGWLESYPQDAGSSFYARLVALRKEAKP